MYNVLDHQTDETIFCGSDWRDAVAATQEANTTTIFESRCINDEFTAIRWHFDAFKWISTRHEVRNENH